MMLLTIILLLIPQILSHTTVKFDESSLSSDMDKLQSKVDEIAESDDNKSESSEESQQNHDNKQIDNTKYEKLVSNAINDATKYIHQTIADEHKHIELNDKIFAVILHHLKKFWFTGQCKRDYSSPCPKGWLLEEEYCLPNRSYNGNCRKYNVNQITTSKQKEDFAYKCKADWPCIDTMQINYNAVCPYNWVHIGNNYCIAPSNYISKCSPFMNFSTFTPDEKAIWSMECNLHWPMTNIHPKGKSMSKDTFFGALSDNGHIIYPQNY